MIEHQTNIRNINNLIARSLSGFNGDLLPVVDRISNLRSGFLCAACSFHGESTQRYKIIIYTYI